MVNRSLVEKKLAKLEHVIKKLKEISSVSWEEFNKDESLRDRAERNLQIAAQVCIDIGSHIIADRGYRSPDSYGDVFKVLYEQDILSLQLAETMQQIAGFRNVLVHEYLDIDNKIVYECLGQLGDFKSFATYIVNTMENDNTIK